MKKELLHKFSLSNLDDTSSSSSSSNANSESTTNLVNESKDLNVSDYLSYYTRRSFQKKNFTRKLPFLSWLKEYNVTKFIADLIAGLTLGLTTIPQVLGVANVAELPPEYGLYSAFIGSFVYIVLGSTKYITVGPTVTTAIITLSYTKGQPPEFSVLLCFLTGVVTLLMSFLQLGFIVNFISKPVISGFTSAAAISITATQLKALLGLSFKANGFLEEITGVVENIQDSQWQDGVFAIVSLASLYFLMKIEAIFSRFGKFSPLFKKFLWILSTSRSVLVVVVATAIASAIGEPSPVLLVGDVPSGMPPFKPPPFSYSSSDGNSTTEFTLGSALREKTSALIVIPLIAFMEHITITKAFAGTSRIDATQELLCLGVANIIGSFFSSIPVTGAFGRTALNYASGAQSPLGGLVTGAVIVTALIVLTPQFYYIPKATLNSVVIMAVIFMVDFDILGSMWRSKRMDLLPWLVTFLVSLFIGLEYGIMSGFVVSVIFLLYYASRPGVKVSMGETGGKNEFLWVEIDRSMTFPSMEYTRYTVMKAATKWGKEGLQVVLDCQFVTFADYTSAQGMCDLFKLFKDKGHDLILFNVKPSVRHVWEVVMSKSGVNPVYCCNEAELDVELNRRKDEIIASKSLETRLNLIPEVNNNIDDSDQLDKVNNEISHRISSCGVENRLPTELG